MKDAFGHPITQPLTGIRCLGCGDTITDPNDIAKHSTCKSPEPIDLREASRAWRYLQRCERLATASA